jgi:hypothetical protein
VTNASHADPSEHEYTVRVVDGFPTSCTCPADEHYDGACKHRVAVAINRAVLEPALAGSLATDGGTVPEDAVNDETDRESECDCDGLPESIPCWACYRNGTARFEPSDNRSDATR